MQTSIFRSFPTRLFRAKFINCSDKKLIESAWRYRQRFMHFNMIDLLYSFFKLPYLDGKFIPVKMHGCRGGICVKKNADVRLAGRLTVGCPDKEKPVVSRLPFNIY